MTISLSGQSVLVVGAGGGIGRATLEAFARQGAKVTAAGRPGEALSAAAAAAV
jgi:NAD(P)-dependent dehydrogenase (short-subunit alcohol dehydrogenase family)